MYFKIVSKWENRRSFFETTPPVVVELNQSANFICRTQGE